MSSALRTSRPMTPEQVADRWGCSSTHVRTLIKRNELRAFRLGPKLIRIPLEAVEEFEQCPESTKSDASREASSSHGGTTESDGVFVLTHARERKRKPKPQTF